MQLDTDEIVLEIASTEIQTEIEVETQPTRERWRRQVRIERWSPLKRRASGVAGEWSIREPPYQPPTKRHQTWPGCLGPGRRSRWFAST